MKNTLSIKNAQLKWRNFSGRKGDFNPAGRRLFCVLLDDADAKRLKNDGWNIKWTKPNPRDPLDDPQAFMEVKVSYSKIPPEIWQITEDGKTLFTEKTIHILDWAEIQYVDLEINPYSYDVQGRKGLSAYVKKMFVTIVEDEFEKKYRNVPEATSDSDGDLP